MPNQAQKEFARIFDMGMRGDLEGIRKLRPAVPDNPVKNWLRRVTVDRRTDAIYKAIGEEMVRRERAQEQGSVVYDTAEMISQTELRRGVMEPVGYAPRELREMAHHCEPAAAIIGTLTRRTDNYCRRPIMKMGYAKEPGIRIRLTHHDEEATPADRVQIAKLEQYILDAGFCAPPEANRPIGWQPGFRAFVAQMVRDSLTFDGAVIRRWDSDRKGRNGEPDKRCIAFCADDAAMYRKVRPEVVAVINGVPQRQPWQGDRTNTQKPIRLVKLADSDYSSMIAEEFTGHEAAYCIRIPRTDVEANGYGYSEMERCVNAITIWILCRRYNSSRFSLDSLPRGILSIMSTMNETMFAKFRNEWLQLLQGEGKRWSNVILKGSPQAGAGVQWLPIDQSSRDMEYHQFSFTVGMWIHAAFGIHPEETGFDATSPFRPPLSEASPETKLEYSQDTCFGPLMHWLAEVVNREILWVLDPTKRYTFEWVGLGQGSIADDIALMGQRLQMGLATPEMLWHELDQPIPEHLKKDPAMKLPGVYAANKQLLMQEDQVDQARSAQEQQMAQQQDAHEQQQAMGKLQQFHAVNHAGEGGEEDEGPEDRTAPGGGMPGAPGAAPGGPPGGGGMPGAPGAALQKALADVLYPWGEPEKHATDRSRRKLRGTLVITGPIPATRKRT